MTADVTRATIAVPTPVYRALKVQAAREGRTVTAIVADLIRAYLKNQPTWEGR